MRWVLKGDLLQRTYLSVTCARLKPEKLIELCTMVGLVSNTIK